MTEEDQDRANVTPLNSSAAQPDGPPRVIPAAPFGALDDLAFAESFNRRHPGRLIVDRATMTDLLAANVRLAAEAREATAGRAAQYARAMAFRTELGKADAERAELLVRRFLDDLVEAGYPSTTYQRASPTFRDYIASRLATLAESSNRLLGQLHGVPTDAWVARDAAHPSADDDDDDTESQVETFRRLLDGDDDDAD